jgi:hypothetical protein
MISAVDSPLDDLGKDRRKRKKTKAQARQPQQRQGHKTPSGGSLAGRASSYPCACSRGCPAGSSWKS